MATVKDGVKIGIGLLISRIIIGLVGTALFVGACTTCAVIGARKQDEDRVQKYQQTQKQTQATQKHPRKQH